MIWLHCWSMSTCIWLMCSSSAPTRSRIALSSSFSRTTIARDSCVSTIPPIDSTPLRMASISASNCLCVCSVILFSRSCRGSAEAAGDVILGFLALGLQEQLVRFAEFDQFAQIHVRREVGHARRLLHVVRDDGDRV